MKFIYCNLLVLFLIAQSSLPAQKSSVYLKKHFGNLSEEAVIDTLIKLSEHFAEPNPDSALFFGKMAYDRAVLTEDNEAIALVSKWMADALYYKNQYREAISWYKQSANAEYTDKNDSTYFYADRLADVAYCYQELGFYDKAQELHFVALKLFIKQDKQQDISNTLNNIGSNYVFRGQYDKAIQYYEKTLQIDRVSGDSTSISKCLNNIGMVYSRWGKHDQALNLFNEALKFTIEEPSKSVRYSNIGMEWYYLKQYEKALEYLYKALEIDTRIKRSIKIGVRKNEIGIVLAAKGLLKEAIKLQEEALLVFKETELKESQIITLADMGDIYRKMDAIGKAETCYLESIRIANESKAFHHLSRNYKNLYEIAESKDDYKAAFNYFKLYEGVNDSIFNAEKHEQIARFEILFDTEKKEQENELLLLDNELKQKRQRLSIAIIISLVFILILLFSLYRIKTKNLQQSQLLLKQDHELAKLELEKKDADNKLLEDRIFAEKQINRLQREKHQAEIEYKNKELANSSICLVNKNEILSEIRDKLKSNHQTETIQEVVRFINSNTDIDQSWHKFKITFEEIYPGFFDRLQGQFPHLTENDTRLSAYLCINLSSREIAGLMNVTLDAINKNRQRLRKKLNLEAEADLTRFLQPL
jgi:tetratricopeptide (TPR) repeat protein